MHSAICALCRRFAICGLTLGVQASCLFRFGLEMNLTYPSSLCMVCSVQGLALCEIEVGSWQYPALCVPVSTDAVDMIDIFVKREDLKPLTEHGDTLL